MNSLICTECKKSFPLHEPIWRCACGGMLDITYNSTFPIEKIKHRPQNMWRYREALPIERKPISYQEGYTPLLPFDYDGKRLFVKQEHLFQTGSFKDRGAALLVNKIAQLGIKEVVEDSSGNAGAAVAAYCARAGIKAEIFVSQYAAQTKIRQIKSYGAKLISIDGNREKVADAALKQAHKIYYASHVWNPFFLHGVKTSAFEICEQLGWGNPNTILVPVGNGSLLLGLFLGFSELQKDGIISKLPRLIAVQAKNCSPIYDSFHHLPPGPKKKTIANGASVRHPVRTKQILDAISTTNGNVLRVEESEITKALFRLWRKGFLVEPTTALTFAALDQYETKENEKIVTFFTGHGLKSLNC